MASFEEAGRRIDRELAKLNRYLDKEVKPAAKRKAVKALNRAAETLADAAKKVEKRLKKKLK